MNSSGSVQDSQGTRGDHSNSKDPLLVLKDQIKALNAISNSRATQHLTDISAPPQRQAARLAKHEFLELVADVHAELLRRKAGDEFVPIGENFHWRRIQARSRLAQLDSSRFEALCRDICRETLRRYPELKLPAILSKPRSDTPSNQSEEAKRTRQRPRESRAPTPPRSGSSPPSDTASVCSATDTMTSAENDQPCQNSSHQKMRLDYEFKIAMVHKAWQESQTKVAQLESELVALHEHSKETVGALSRLQRDYEDLRERRAPITTCIDEDLEELQLLRHHYAQVFQEKEELLATLDHIITASLGAKSRIPLLPRKSSAPVSPRPSLLPSERKPLYTMGPMATDHPGHAHTASNSSLLTLVDHLPVGCPTSPSPSSAAHSPDSPSESEYSEADDPEAWPILRVYIQAQTKPAAISVRNLLAGTERSALVSAFREDVEQTLAISSSIIACCRGQFPSALAKHGNELLNLLNAHSNDLGKMHSSTRQVDRLSSAMAHSALGVLNAIKDLSHI